MKIYNLSSGSKGNATLIVCGLTKILIDAGTTRKYLKESLSLYNYQLEDIDIILVTHFHTDHTKALKYFDTTKIYSNAMEHNQLLLNEDNIFNDLIIHPFELSHDEACLAYQIKYNNEIYTHISDTGYLKKNYLKYIKESNYLYLEFNHDIELLRTSNRPPYLIRRILSDEGHLNNQDAALFLCKGCTSNLKQLLVAHISDEANDVKVIEETIKSVFNDYSKEINFEITYTKYCEISRGGNFEG